MERLAADQLDRVLGSERGRPCVSIYLPVGTTEEHRESAKARLARLMQRAEVLLTRHYPGIAPKLLGPLQNLLTKMPWQPGASGFALFSSERVAGYVPFGGRVPELAVVSDSFHVKPILPLAQAQERFCVVLLAPGIVRVYDGRREGLEEAIVYRIREAEPRATRFRRSLTSRKRPAESRRLTAVPSLDPLTDRAVATFYRDVEAKLRRRLGRKRVPVILAGSKHEIGLFRSTARYRVLAADEIILDTRRTVDSRQLHESAWPIAQTLLRQRQKRITRDYRVMRLRGLVAERLDEVAKAAHERRVETLFLEAGVQVWGRYENGRLVMQRDRFERPCDDLLDDLAELVLEGGGRVYVLDPSEMPARAHAVAILRR